MSEVQNFNSEYLTIALKYDTVIKLAIALDARPDIRSDPVLMALRDKLWTYRGLIDELRARLQK